MKLTTIAKKPELIKIELDDIDTIKEYGEPLEFWCYDRQPLETFMKFAGKAGDPSIMIEIVRDLILDDEGKPVMTEGNILPNKVMMRAVNKITDVLGN